jgi:hypothetical protein
LLAEHVREGGWVDYDGLRRDEEELDAYVRSLADAPFDSLGRDEKLALLLDAYNAFTLRLVLDHEPLASIRDIPEEQRWKAVRWRVGPYTWSLDHIEHVEIRPKFREPRVHFALVCAAAGCPPLRREAYTGERIEEQLEEQAIAVHASERWLRADVARETLHLTRLYDWFEGDFEQVAGSPLAFAARYSPSLSKALAEGKEPRVRWLEYDWSLNRAPPAR